MAFRCWSDLELCIFPWFCRFVELTLETFAAVEAEFASPEGWEAGLFVLFAATVAALVDDFTFAVFLAPSCCVV